MAIANAYDGNTLERSLLPGQSTTTVWDLESSFGWYDLSITETSDPSFARRLAGHVETGKESVSDPAFSS